MYEALPPFESWSNQKHWKDREGRSFQNPWSSFNKHSSSKWKLLKVALIHPKRIPVPTNIHEIYRVMKPQWSDFASDRVRATWIGHATFVLELPKQNPSHARGIRILFDPVFSEYTAPDIAIKFGLGPKRYSKLPCPVDDLPEIDVVCISHNHYDHMDSSTVQMLEARTNKSMQYICGLNNKRHFTEFGINNDRIHELDWGDNGRITVPELDASFELTCCPSQHTSARWFNDTDHSLWCSWLIKSPQTESSVSKKIYFGGDTGYRYTPTDEREGWPVCPVFKELGKEHGSIDLAMLPIGLYSPRSFLSNVHLCPEDSVDVHMDIKAKKSVGMHFGTFRGGLSRNFEDVLEPPRRLKAEMKKRGLPADSFITINIGGSIEA